MYVIFECAEVVKKYGSLPALNSISLKAYANRTLALLGPSGSGKSVFMRTVAGLSRCDSGTISLALGINIEKKSYKNKYQKELTSYLPEQDYLPDELTVADIIKLFIDYFSNFFESYAMKFAADLNINLNKKYGKLSKTQRAAVRLMLTLSRHSCIYILDEPFAELDSLQLDYFIREMSENMKGKTIILSTNMIAQSEPLFDDVVFFQNGTVRVCDSANAIRENSGMCIADFYKETFKC